MDQLHAHTNNIQYELYILRCIVHI